MRAWGGLLLCGAVLLPAVPAAAQDEAECVRSLPDEDVEARLDFIERTLDRGRPRARSWWGIWLALNFTSVMVQYTYTYTATNSGSRKDSAMAAILPAIGTLQLVLRQFEELVERPELDAMPVGTPEERVAKLRRAEGLLRGARDRQRAETGWIPHVGAVLVTGTAALVHWLALDRPDAAWQAFLLNMAGAEIRTWSVPRYAIRGWRRYGEEHGLPLCPEAEAEPVPAARPRPAARVTVGPGGFALTVSF